MFRAASPASRLSHGFAAPALGQVLAAQGISPLQANFMTV